MPEYNRFDIADAHYWWNVHHHSGQWSKEYARQCAIAKYFSPSLLANGPETDNAKEIYTNLCAKHECVH